MSAVTGPREAADLLASQALLNCLVREVSGPEQQTWEDSGHLVIRLPRSGRVLRAQLRRPAAGLTPRLTGQAQLSDGGWLPVGCAGLTALIRAELGLATGVDNDELAGQVAGSRAATEAILRARDAAGGPGPAADDMIGRYLDSEQALVAGHRYHPAPKARGGRPESWLAYAPEARARFPLHFLAVRDDAAAGDGEPGALSGLGAPAAPAGYQALPVHPWQRQLIAGRPWLRRALRDGRLADLGPGGRDVAATSSVRTVYDPAGDVFAKFSLDVRITNCVRVSAWPELAGSVALTRLLAPVAADLAARFPGTVLLAEPGYRTVSLGSRAAFENLAVIAREGLRARLAPGVTPLLAGSLAEPPLPGAAPGLLDGRDPAWLEDWWESYLRVVAAPALDAYFRHGVVLEPHLQNVLVGVDAAGRPAQAVFRDLEGTKLVASRHEAVLAAMTPGVARSVSYNAARGWNRVAYCLLVNHLAEIASAVADRWPAGGKPPEAALWEQARTVIAGIASDHGWPAELRAVLAGVPLPAKANLTVRWHRGADREAGYVPVPSPLRTRAAGPAPELSRAR